MEKEDKRTNIIARLQEIDILSIRAIRDNDEDYLEAYRQEAIKLREELRALQ